MVKGTHTTPMLHVCITIYMGYTTGQCVGMPLQWLGVPEAHGSCMRLDTCIL